MKKIVSGLIALTFSLGTMAQGNMIQNGSFESVSKKIKEAGSIDLAYPWTAATEQKPDIFHTKSKGEDWSNPVNKFGDADPKEGSGYAGIVIYSYKDENPRSYLQIKLSSTLEEEKVYCVKMNVMLAMLSKYSSNNIGIHLSPKPVDIEALNANAITPQIIHSQNRIFEEMFDWEEICQTFIAKGGERYLTIGNFGATAETTVEKVKKPKGITGQQVRTSYYYIDEVSVMNMAGVESCDCETDGAGESLNVVYSSERSSEMEVDATEDIEMSRVYFTELSSELTDDAMTTVTKVAELLKSHPTYKVQIIGHTDPVEEVKVTGEVSLNRATLVETKLIELGAYEKKIMVTGVQDFDPATSDASSAGQAQNRRVQFKVISKE